MFFEADNSEILGPIVTAISFSSMKILIFNQSPNASDVSSKSLMSFFIPKTIFIWHGFRMQPDKTLHIGVGHIGVGQKALVFGRHLQQNILKIKLKIKFKFKLNLI